MAQTAIKATKIVKCFGVGEAKVRAVQDVDIETYYGEMVFIIGPSGSGKTTLLSMLSGILRPDAGEVDIDGINIWKQSNSKLAKFRLNRIGFVFQDYHLFPHLTTAENVAIPLILKGKSWGNALKEATKYLDIVGLKDRANLKPVKLSGGEQQRVAIARAIVSQPELLILDEPTASLDGETGRNIISFVKNNILTEKRCIVIVSHDSRIYEFADRILKMEDGKLSGIESMKHEE